MRSRPGNPNCAPWWPPMTNPDLSKQRREYTRWLILTALNNGRWQPMHEQILLGVVQAIFADATSDEVRRKLDYLEKRELVNILRDPSGPWRAELTRHGVDVAEYTVDCDAGIARPPKYW